MSRLYDMYVKEKEINKDLFYLFECGKFYIFLDEDAKKISSITTLKLTNLNSDIAKCGFPINCLDKYMILFNNLNICIKIINKEKVEVDINKIIKRIEKIDINNITPIESLKILNEIKESIHE